MRTIWNETQLELLRRSYETQGTDLVEQLPFSARQIVSKAAKLGLKVSKERLSSSASKRSSKPRPGMCGVDATKFDSPLLPEAAYILGLLWADGAFFDKTRKIALEMLETDLSELLPIFEVVGKWTISRRQRLNRQPQMTIQTTNKCLFSGLQSLGFVKKRLNPATVIERIPIHLRFLWFRGFFDGDGCVYINEKRSLRQISFAGAFEQDWEPFLAMLRQLQIKPRLRRWTSKKGHRGSAISFGGLRNCATWAEYLYPAGTERWGLSRKRDKLNAICEQYAVKINAVHVRPRDATAS